MVLGRLVVKLGRIDSHGDIVTRKMEVTCVDSATDKSTNTLIVTMIQLISWPQQGLPHPAAIISLADILTNSLIRSSSKKTVVVCRSNLLSVLHSQFIYIIMYSGFHSDGVVRSGTFICIHSQLERLKTEGVVDVFQAIKSARIQRHGLIPNTVSSLLTSQCLSSALTSLLQRIITSSVMKFWPIMLRIWICMPTLKQSCRWRETTILQKQAVLCVDSVVLQY